MIGSLLEKLIIAVKLDLDDFDDEIDEAGDKVDGLGSRSEKSFGRMGKSWGAVGAKVAVGVAAVGAAAVAAGAAFVSMANDIAREAKDLANSAQVAGEGFEEFQRQAFAARTVGLEFDQLGDIFKDVRERVGEFVVTGGGPLQDAFDAVSGKVRLTVDELRGLSGRDGLQLIVSRMEEAGLSTEEMSFVLESLGSEATRLLPLLRNNGEAMERLGESAAVISDEDRERLAEYSIAQMELGEALREVQIALVTSGLLDALVSFTKMLADGVSDALEFAKAIGLFGGNAEDAADGMKMLEDADLGFLGEYITQFREAFGPQIAEMIEKIRTRFSELLESEFGENLEKAIPFVIEFYTQMLKAASVVVDVVFTIIEAVGDVVAFVSSVLDGDWRGAWQAAGGFVDTIIQGLLNVLSNFAPNAAEHLRALYEAAKTWLQDRLGSVVRWVEGKLEELEEAFAWLYDRVVGNSHIPDMVQRIGEEMAKLQSLMVDPATKATQSTEEAFRSLAQNTEGLLARLFPVQTRIREIMDELELLDQALAAGIISPEVAAAARDELRGERINLRREVNGPAPVSLTSAPLQPFDQEAIDELLNTMIELPPIASKAQIALEEFGFEMGNAINNALISVLEGRDFFDSLKRAFFVSMGDIITQALGDLNSQLFGDGGLGGVLGSFFSGILGGGARAVGGPVLPGRAYDVGLGEKFVPSMPGRVLSRNDAMAAMGGGERLEITVAASPEFDVKMRRVADNSASAAVAGYDRVVGSRVQKNLKRRG